MLSQNIKSVTDAISAAKQDSLTFGAVTDTGAVVLSQNIKSYGDANWAGGGGTADPVITGVNATYTVANDFAGTIFWGRSEYFQTGGSQITITLPTTGVVGQSFDVQCLNGQGTGQIFLNIPGASSAIWNSYAWSYNSEIYGVYPGGSQNLLIQNVGYMRFGVNYIESGGQGYWYAYPRTNLNQSRTNTAGIATNLASIATNTTAIANQRYFKFFGASETGYIPISGNHFTIPSGYREVQIVYGDGMEATKANVSGVWLNLPATPSDGDTVRHLISIQLRTVMCWSWIFLRRVISLREEN